MMMTKQNSPHILAEENTNEEQDTAEEDLEVIKTVSNRVSAITTNHTGTTMEDVPDLKEIEEVIQTIGEQGAKSEILKTNLETQ